MDLWLVLLGWPAIVLALTLSTIGIIQCQSAWVFVGAGLLLPICLYLAGTPLFGWLGLVLPFIMVGAGVALKQRRIKTAMALLFLVIVVFSYLAVLVVTE